MTAPFLAHALRLAARGFRVHPLHPGTKLPRYKGWHERATTEEAFIHSAWNSCPNANIGIATSRHAFVLDVDPKNGGIESLGALIALHGNLPDTPQVKTGGGGLHYYLSTTESIRNSQSKLGPGLDIRGEGGFVVAPPSVTTGLYKWIVDPRTPIAPAPEWLLAPLRSVERVPEFVAPSGDLTITMRKASRYLAKMPEAVAGSRGHDATFRAAVALVCGWSLDSESAYMMLATEYNPRCAPPWTEKELRHKVASAVKANRAGRGYLLKRTA